MKKGTCRFHTSRMRAVRVRPVQACPRAALPSGPAGQKSSSRSKVPPYSWRDPVRPGSVGPCHGGRPTARSVLVRAPANGEARQATGQDRRCCRVGGRDYVSLKVSLINYHLKAGDFIGPAHLIIWLLRCYLNRREIVYLHVEKKIGPFNCLSVAVSSKLGKMLFACM